MPDGSGSDLPVDGGWPRCEPARGEHSNVVSRRGVLDLPVSILVRNDGSHIYIVEQRLRLNDAAVEPLRDIERP
jgi:hypothetical protein